MLIKNTKNTLNAATGTDLIFEPGEVKEVDERIRELALTLGEGFVDVAEEPKEKPKSELNVDIEHKETDFPFKCGACGKVCKSKAGLISHLRKH
jgi:hypothetical protein